MGEEKKLENPPEKIPRKKAPQEKPPSEKKRRKFPLGYSVRPNEDRADPILVQSSTRPKAEENFARATESKTDEAKGRGGLNFTICDYVHLVSGYS